MCCGTTPRCWCLFTDQPCNAEVPHHSESVVYVMPTGGLRFGHCVLREYIRLWIARNTSILYGCTPHTRTQSEIRGREEQRRRARGGSVCDDDGNKNSQNCPPSPPPPPPLVLALSVSSIHIHPNCVSHSIHSPPLEQCVPSKIPSASHARMVDAV